MTAVDTEGRTAQAVQTVMVREKSEAAVDAPESDDEPREQAPVLADARPAAEATVPMAGLIALGALGLLVLLLAVVLVLVLVRRKR